MVVDDDTALTVCCDSCPCCICGTVWIVNMPRGNTTYTCKRKCENTYTIFPRCRCTHTILLLVVVAMMVVIIIVGHCCVSLCVQSTLPCTLATSTIPSRSRSAKLERHWLTDWREVEPPALASPHVAPRALHTTRQSDAAQSPATPCTSVPAPPNALPVSLAPIHPPERLSVGRARATHTRSL